MINILHYREMKLTSILFRKTARQPQNEKKVPFKEILPLQLRNFVSGKNQRTAGIFNSSELMGFIGPIQLYYFGIDGGSLFALHSIINLCQDCQTIQFSITFTNLNYSY